MMSGGQWRTPEELAVHKFPWFLRAVSKNDLIAWLILLGLTMLLASVAAQKFSPWIADLLINFGASFFAFVVAVVLVDAVMKDHERNLAQAERDAQQQIEDELWRPVRRHIGFYVGIVANRCALAYRTAAGIGDDELPYDKLGRNVPEIERLSATASWIKGTIIPALPNLGRRTRDEWEFLLRTLQKADDEAKDDLLIFGDRLKPEIYEQLLEIRRGIKRAFESHELYESVLGGPDEPKFVTPDMHIIRFFELGRQHHRPLPEVIVTVTNAAVDDAVVEAEHILSSAVRLLHATIPLLPAEDGSQTDRQLDIPEAQMSERETRIFDFGPLPVLSPKAGESLDLFEGYYRLERDERRAMLDALRRHTREVTLWYGFLSNYRRTLEGEIRHPPDDVAFGARRQILSLGLTSSKAALDAVLAGYYSVAYCSIRHMCECWFVSRYLECHPEKYLGLYAPAPGAKKVKLPEIDSLIKDVEACDHALAPAAAVKEMRRIWVAMSKGAHLTGEGIVLTASTAEGIVHLGATYVPEMAVPGFAAGLHAGYYLVREALWHLRGESSEAAEIAKDLRRELDEVFTYLEQTYGDTAEEGDLDEVAPAQ
jgi:hypothetical protein